MKNIFKHINSIFINKLKIKPGLKSVCVYAYTHTDILHTQYCLNYVLKKEKDYFKMLSDTSEFMDDSLPHC